MKKRLTRVLCVLTVLAALLCSCVLASAASAGVDSIQVTEPQHGTVEVKRNAPTEALITLTPDQGYLTAAVSLKQGGTSLPLTPTDTPNVYRCTIPESSSTLTVTFRRTTVTLSKSELALSTGDTASVTAKLAYVDDEVSTRVRVANNDVVYTSSDPEVVSVDAKTGAMTAKKMGFSRITATATAGNGVESFFYVIVDGDKSPVVGTLQVNAWFEEKAFIDDFLPGHSFLIFTNTSGEDVTIDTSNMYLCDDPTEKFYDAVNSYNGEGYDPLTFAYTTNGAAISDEDKDARKAYAETLFTRYERGELKNYTIAPNRIATFGNTGDVALESLLGGGMEEILTRYGKSFALNQIKADLLSGRIDIEDYLDRVWDLLKELGYDFYTGYNPINAAAENGGECVNHELYSQSFSRNYAKAAACKTTVTRLQLEAMVDFVQQNNYFTILERNCTQVACGAWNLVTADRPQYQLQPNWGGITNALAAPMWLKSSIVAKSVVLSGDENIEFYHGIGVIKPAKDSCMKGDHSNAEVKNATITKDGVCANCGVTVAGSTLKTLTLEKGHIYCENALGVWRSSNRKVAVTLLNGTIVAKASGTTTITCQRGGTTYTCQLTVK